MEQRFPFHPHFLNKVFEVYGLMPRNEMTRGGYRIVCDFA
jgi:hypothetical protein